MSEKIHFIATAVASAALSAGCSQPEGTVPRNTNSQKEGSRENTSEVQNITSSKISMTGQPGKGAVIHMTAGINSDNLMETYQTLGTAPTDRVAVKLSTGEPGSNYLRTNLIGGLIQSLQAVVVECNTAYGGARSNTATYYQVAEDHGCAAIAGIDIMDEGGSMTSPVTGGINLTENYVGEYFSNYDYYVIPSHFKDHAMTGFGGAVKNISTRPTSAEGRNHIHTAGRSGSMRSASQDSFLESMVEIGKSATDALNGNTLYINVVNRLSADCDCDASPAESDMYDIRALISYDPVALDQACTNLVYAAADEQSLVNRVKSRDGIHTLKQTEKIGLGGRIYTLVNLDE